MWLILTKLACTGLFLLALAKYKFFYILSRTYKRDFRALLRLRKAVPIIFQNRTLNKPTYYYFNQVVAKHPQKVAFLFEDESWTFADVKELADKFATYFEREGYQKGDSVALLLNNCPDYVCVWLGLSQIGVITALINTNLVNKTLLHSLQIANCKGIIFGENFGDSVISCVQKRLDIKCYQYNRSPLTSQVIEGCVNLSQQVRNVSPNVGSYNITSADSLVYIYTSGTTGLPKAAILNHKRFCTFRALYATLHDNPENIRMYVPLPLYHGGGGFLGCGHAVLSGASVVLKSKFSASNYWKDCIKYNCNAAQYIGEMCRYILSNCPEGNLAHPVKTMFGNGLKQQVWKQFQSKYGIKHIFEFYASTEGNFFLMNFDNKVGSCGFIPSYLQKLSLVQLIKYSEVTGEPIRDENGLCQKVAENEPGLAVGFINNKKHFADSFAFVGYLDNRDTSKKILQDVFTKGDQYFNSGDVLSYDEFGYYYFVDRLGDTFRWKGENVSTSEVEGVISNILGLNDAIVYGVEIPGSEGRAGMASVVSNPASLDLDSILQQFKTNLPLYAVPLFIRFKASLPVTVTFKLQKYDLKKEGFNINIVDDPIYFYHQKLDKYVHLTTELYTEINTGKMKL